MKPEDICIITNRSPGSALYAIPEEHIRREFNSRETKKVPYKEILAVASQPGGRELLYNYFYIKDPKIVEEALNVKPEVEYFMTEDQIPGWIKSCSLDEFKDALDFAPDGVKSLIKEISVSLPLNDVEKREALLNQLGFDCEKAIKNEKDTKADQEEEKANKSQQGRRVQPNTKATEEKPVTNVRRVIKKTSE